MTTEMDFGDWLIKNVSGTELIKMVGEEQFDDDSSEQHHSFDPNVTHFWLYRKRRQRKQFKFGTQLVKEFHLLICTKDKKYRPLRNKLIKSAKTTELFIVGSLSSAFAVNFGASATVLGPPVAMILLVFLQMAKRHFANLLRHKLLRLPQSNELVYLTADELVLRNRSLNSSLLVWGLHTPDKLVGRSFDDAVNVPFVEFCGHDPTVGTEKQFGEIREQ